MVLCTVLWLGFAECDGLSSPPWLAGVEESYWIVWCGACCWVPWPPPAPWCGVWLPVCPPGRLPGACWCGVGVLVGWWFENWIVDASIGPPVGVGLVFVL